MKAFFKDVLEYHHYFNQLLADVFTKNKERISPRTIPLFSHVINAQQIWNARITGSEEPGVHEVHSLKKCKNLDAINFKDSIEILESFDLDQKIKYLNSKRFEYENTVSEIFFHISNHSTHHKGQLISDLRSCGIEPPVTDYIFYKR
ncbi:MAG: DinB family protein [Salinimicrobium sp.]